MKRKKEGNKNHDQSIAHKFGNLRNKDNKVTKKNERSDTDIKDDQKNVHQEEKNESKTVNENRFIQSKFSPSFLSHICNEIDGSPSKNSNVETKKSKKECNSINDMDSDNEKSNIILESLSSTDISDDSLVEISRNKKNDENNLSASKHNKPTNNINQTTTLETKKNQNKKEEANIDINKSKKLSSKINLVKENVQNVQTKGKKIYQKNALILKVNDSFNDTKQKPLEKNDFKNKQQTIKLINHDNVQNKKSTIPVSNTPQNEITLKSVFEVPTSEGNEPFINESIFFETSQADIKDIFVFDTHEEGGKLYLFCKYSSDPSQYGTICLCIGSPTYKLYFSPSNDVSDQLVEKEINFILKRFSKEGLISDEKKWVEKKVIDGNITSRYLEVNFSSNFNIADIPIKGKTYDAVYGSSSTLVDQFLTHKNIKGPKWLSVHCSQSPRLQTSVPMYISLNTSQIDVIDLDQKPSMNICIFSMIKKENQVFMISMRIFYQWNYESLDTYKGLYNSRRVIITFVLAPENDSKKRDSTTIYCNNESEVLSGFVEKLEQFDIDIICSYDLINHDLPFIIERIRKNNLSQWARIGRHFRSIFTNSLTLITSGRMLLDLKLTFQNLLGIETHTFSSLVRKELGIDRPTLEFLKGLNLNDFKIQSDNNTFQFSISSQKLIEELISLNRKDTHFIKQILERKNIILLCEHISNITGQQWSKVMIEPPELFIESLINSCFHKNGYLVPDRKQSIYKYKFKSPEIQSTFLNKKSALLYMKFFFVKVIQMKNLCFSNLNQNAKEKSKGVLPKIITKYLNIYNNINSEESQNKKLQAQSLSIILNSFKRYFQFGSQRYDLSKLGQSIEAICNNFFKHLEKKYNLELIYLGDSLENPEAFIGIEKNENNKESIISNIDHFNDHHKNIRLDIIKQFSKLLLLENGSYFGIDDEGKLSSYNFNYYRYDWCPATKIIADNLMTQIMVSNEYEKDILELFKELNHLLDLTPSDYAIPLFFHNIHNDICVDSDYQYFTNERSFNSHNINIFIQQHLEDIQEIITKTENKRSSLYVDGKISFIVSKDHSLKSVENVKSIDEIDLNWYKNNQIADAIVDLLKPFKIFSAQQIYSSFNVIQALKYESDELSFYCSFCNQKNAFKEMSADCFHCQNCGIKLHWKFLANSLTHCIQRLISRWSQESLKCNHYLCKYSSDQFPILRYSSHKDPSNSTQLCTGKINFEYSSSDIYEHILFFEDMFDKSSIQDRSNKKLIKLSKYMKEYIIQLKHFHEFDSLNFSSLLTNQSSTT